MKVLLCHNYYQQLGGEDLLFEDEARLLESRGHEVLRYTRHNDEIKSMNGRSVAQQTLWSRQSYGEVRALIRRERPSLMHCTNTFPLISPAVYYAARDEKVPVVQALQNYRLLCPNGQFLREGQVCESCLGKTIPWPAIRHGCYRGSRAASLVVAGMLTFHRMRKTWTQTVRRYFTPSAFTRQKFLEAGMPPQMIDVKPNFVDPDPGAGTGRGGHAVFVGRLSPEKGIDTLLEAWKQLPERVQLTIVGDGPLADIVQAAARKDGRITWLGRRPPSDVQRIVSDAACLLLPSVWYEGFPRTMVEALACGTPVIASRLGSMSDTIDDGRTGLLFEPGNAGDLAAKIKQFFAQPLLEPMRAAARREYEARYTAETNYEMLMQIYRRAINVDSSQAMALVN